jgi:single-strand DNA-binding protein
MNNISIMGNVGSVDEPRYAASGTCVMNFSVAVNRRYKGEDEVTWFRCVAFSGLAEMLEKHLEKGAKVAVTGRMSCRKWEDKNGNARDSWELVVQDFYFAGSRGEGGGRPQSRHDEQKSNGYAPNDDDSDVPF